MQLSSAYLATPKYNATGGYILRTCNNKQKHSLATCATYTLLKGHTATTKKIVLLNPKLLVRNAFKNLLTQRMNFPLLFFKSHLNDFFSLASRSSSILQLLLAIPKSFVATSLQVMVAIAKRLSSETGW